MIPPQRPLPLRRQRPNAGQDRRCLPIRPSSGSARSSHLEPGRPSPRHRPVQRFGRSMIPPRCAASSLAARLAGRTEAARHLVSTLQLDQPATQLRDPERSTRGWAIGQAPQSCGRPIRGRVRRERARPRERWGRARHGLDSRLTHDNRRHRAPLQSPGQRGGAPRPLPQDVRRNQPQHPVPSRVLATARAPGLARRRGARPRQHIVAQPIRVRERAVGPHPTSLCRRRSCAGWRKH